MKPNPSRTRKQLPECPDSELAYLLQPQYQVRRLQPCDYRDVLRIQRSCYPGQPITADQITRLLYETEGFHGLVIDRRDSLSALESETIGYCIYNLGKFSIDLISIGVALEYRREKAGTRLIEKGILSIAKEFENYKRVRTLVREENLVAQLFFKKLGFKWVNTVNGLLQDKHSRYVFIHTLERKDS